MELSKNHFATVLLDTGSCTRPTSGPCENGTNSQTDSSKTGHTFFAIFTGAGKSSYTPLSDPWDG